MVECSSAKHCRILSLDGGGAIRPRVLLFDEPLSNLDARLRIQMRVEIRALQRRLSITTLYVTHDQQEAMAVPVAETGAPDWRLRGWEPNTCNRPGAEVDAYAAKWPLQADQRTLRFGE